MEKTHKMNGWKTHTRRTDGKNTQDERMEKTHDERMEKTHKMNGWNKHTR
jgi:hypothetical protein